MKRVLSFGAACVAAGAILAGALSGSARAESAVTITLDPKSPGAAVPDDFTGVSYEMALVLPGPGGKYFFSADNKPLIEMFHTLGLKSLRVGGNTADRPTVNIPAPADLDKLFAFAEAAGVKVIFTLRLRQSNPAEAVKVAKYVMEHYQSDVACFAIGNEPNVFDKTYPAYRADLEKYMAAIRAVAPDAKFCGPSTTPNKAEWARDLATDFGHSGKIVLITQHDYPGGNSRTVTIPAAARDKMLSTDWVEHYQKFYDSFAPTAVSNGLPYRLEEANSFYNGGAKDVSDTLASALWGLDYLHWWAAHGASGINLHTGDSVAAGEQNTPCRYAVFVTSTNGYLAHPLAYAVKAFNLGGQGKLVPVQFSTNSDNVNLTAYGVLAGDGDLCVTLINKEHGSGARDAIVSVQAGDGYERGESMLLAAPQGDAAAAAGTTLGGAEIQEDAVWKGAWTPLTPPSNSGQFTVRLPAATAAVVKLKRKW